MKTLVEFNGFWFGENTPEKVKNIISNIGRDRRVRVWYGDNKTGKSWNEENDVCGYIGRSTGTKKIPLLVSNSRSLGGGALLDDCIIKIVETKTGRVLYQHENFNQSVFVADHLQVLYNGGDTYARCKSSESAIRLADFMNGKRHNK